MSKTDCLKGRLGNQCFINIAASLLAEKFNLYIIYQGDNELFPLFAGAKYFSKIDLHSGYYQIPIAKADREKTAFVTRYGSYEFLVLPMGLCNSPGTFMELMNTLFTKQLENCVIVYMDDIVVYSKTVEEHEKHLTEVLNILKEQKLYAKLAKCNLVRR
jgi:hypothetical protein